MNKIRKRTILKRERLKTKYSEEKNRKYTILKRKNLVKDNSEQVGQCGQHGQQVGHYGQQVGHCGQQVGHCGQHDPKQDLERAGSRAILVYTWLCSVAN